MARTYFIAGTDTGVGKSFIAASLLEAGNQRGLRTAALKPLAAGADETPEGLRNEDAVLLRAHASVAMSYEQVNPVLLSAPIAPHLAAAQEGRRLSAERLEGFCRGAMMTPSDLLLIEGAGGWRVPLNGREMLSDLPRRLRVPVILVVGMRLGCLNHAVLTAEAIAADGLQLAGWVANRIDPEMSCFDDNLATLQGLLQAPLLGTVPYQPQRDPRGAAQYLGEKLDILLGK